MGATGAHLFCDTHPSGLARCVSPRMCCGSGTTTCVKQKLKARRADTDSDDDDAEPKAGERETWKLVLLRRPSIRTRPFPKELDQNDDSPERHSDLNAYPQRCAAILRQRHASNEDLERFARNSFRRDALRMTEAVRLPVAHGPSAGENRPEVPPYHFARFYFGTTCWCSIPGRNYRLHDAVIIEDRVDATKKGFSFLIGYDWFPSLCVAQIAGGGLCDSYR